MTSDDLITLTARGLTRAARDYVVEAGPAAAAAGTGLALTVAAVPLPLALLAALAVLLAVGHRLWTPPRLGAAAAQRTSRRTTRAVLDRWGAACVAGRLVTHEDRVPTVTLVEPLATVTGSLLNLHLDLPPGLTGDDVEAAAGRLAVALGAARVEVEPDPLAAAVVIVRVVLDDPLAAPAAERSPLLDARAPWHPSSCVPIGRLADGSLLAPELLGQHWLIAGMTGTGKSTTAQAVAAFLALCSPGTARAVVLDPKGGAEFAWLAAASLAADVVGASTEDACVALSQVVEEMHRRQARCARAGARSTEPGIVEPLIVVLIDEAAAYRRDKRHRDEFDRLLTLLAEQGRSSAICIVLLTQTPSVENVPSSIRNNLGVRLVHRCATASHSEVALGDGTAKQPGWDASRLPYGRQYAGLGLAVAEQTAGRPRRFRSFLLDDEQLAEVQRVAVARRHGHGMMTPCQPTCPSS